MRLGDSGIALRRMSSQSITPGIAGLTAAREGAGAASRPRPGLPRVADVLLSAAALVVLAPLMAALAVLIRCTSRGPALFRQVRLGQDQQPFVMLKFRTMYVDSDDRLHREYVGKLLTEPADEGHLVGGLYKLGQDPRVTPMGRLLRRASLDELPQLVNVLRGDMALVGPRPALPWEAAMFTPRQAMRFQVRPGITGLWQTSGRSKLTMTEALELDVEYVERRALRLDCGILVRTIGVVLSREGAR
jgi:lipopolysaccharide/colanic/teichoic acid biosynthesis glycosyltransferase